MIGVVLYATAAVGYFRLYQRRRAQFLLGVALSFALLAEYGESHGQIER